MGMDSPEQGYTLKEAAEALGVSEKTVRRRVRRGELKAKVVDGKYGQEYRIESLPIPVTKGRGDPINDYPALVNRLEELSQEVGFWRGKYEELASQVKLLKAPRVHWWQRLFSRR